MHDTRRRSNPNLGINIVGVTIGAGVATFGACIALTTPMAISERWGGIVTIFAAFGVAFVAVSPINWVSQRYQLDKPTRNPVSWRIRRRWYGPHQPVTVDGRRAAALDWTDEGLYGPRTWVLVMSWADGAHLDDNRVEWRPIEDLTPRRAS